MKIQLQSEQYLSMFNLGIEMWFPPRPRSWKRLQITILLGPYSFSVTFGSRQEYNKFVQLLKDSRQ